MCRYLKNRVKFLIPLFLIISVPSLYVHADDKYDDLQVYKKFFELSGGKDRFDQMLKKFIMYSEENFTQNLSDVAENPECVNPDDKDEFKELAKQTIINFSTRLNEEITQTMTIDGLVEELYYPVLSKYLTIEDIKVLIKFYESPSILKFIQERNIIDQEIDESADHYIKKLEDVSKEICESEKTKLFNQFD